MEIDYKRLGEEIARNMLWPEVMDLETAARYIDRSYDVLRAMVRTREIPAVVHGSRKFIRRGDLDAWAEKLLV